MKVPSNNRWIQTNNGDFSGIVHSTFNQSLERQGTALSSRKPFSLYTSDDDANLAYVLSILYFNNNYLALTSDDIFSFNINAGIVSQVSGSPTLFLGSDAIVCYGRYYVTTSTTTDYWNSSSWAGNQETLTASIPHPMAVFDSLTTYKLAIGNGNSVKLIDSSGNLSGTLLTIPAQYQVTTLRYRNGYLYVGTKHLNGGDAKIFIWDGNTANANYEVPTGSSWVFSMCEYGNSVAAITEKGQLLYVSGTSATQLAALPVYFDPNATWQGSSGLSLNGKVMNRGMVAVGDTIYLNIDAELDAGFIPEMRSGLWVYDPESGLNHRSMHSIDRWVQDGALSVTDSVITTSAAHNLKTGDAVQFTIVSGLSGVDTQVSYYVDVQSTTSFKLALSRKALKNGKYVSITGTATSDEMVYVPNTDWAAGYDGAQGAIALTTPLEAQLGIWDSPVVWGARVSDFDGNALYTLQCFTDSWNISHIETQKILTSKLIETWSKVVGFIFGVNLSNEEAILKYKAEETFGKKSVLAGAWGDTNRIHSNSASYDEDEWNDISVGDEVTIVDGYGRGYTAHVTKIDTTATTYVVYLDEDVGLAGKNVYFYASEYKKVQSLSANRQHSNLLEWAWTAVKSPFIQLKVELRGYESGLTALDISSTKNK